MGKAKYAFEILLGIGFKIGLLIAIVGTFVMFFPLMQNAVNPLLEYYGFWKVFNANPVWVKVVSMGLLFMGIAFFISILNTWFDPLIELLFFEDNYLKPK